MPTLIKQTHLFAITVDPNDKYPDASVLSLLEATGFLGDWVLNYLSQEDPSMSLKDHVQKAYGFRQLHPMTITLHPDDHLSYPGDPDYFPLVIIERPEASPPLRCMIYQYGIVALVQDSSTFITRMD